MLDTTSPAVDNASPSYITFRSDQVCLRSKFERLPAQSDQHFQQVNCCCQVNADWVLTVTERLLASTHGGLKAAQEVLPHAVAQQILEALYSLLKQEPTVVDVSVEQLFDGSLPALAVKFHINYLSVCRWHQQHQTSLSW